MHGDGSPCQCDRCRQIWLKSETGDTKPQPADDINAILYHELVNQLELSVAGTFASKTTEYTWFRNLNAKQHISRFGSPTNRIIDFTAEHPGGQIPVSIDILNDVHLIIHIGSSANCLCFLKLIHYAICNDGRLSGVSKVLDETKGCGGCEICKLTDELKQQLEKQERLYPLHLGRAEDWVVFEDVRLVVLSKWDELHPVSTKLYHWITDDFKNYDFGGLRYRIPTFYSLQDNRRLFLFKEGFLNDGELEPSPEATFEKEIEPPIYLDQNVQIRNNNIDFIPVFLSKITD